MKKKTFRERFEENYMAVSVPANNKKGFKVRYVYYKPWHIWDLSQEELKKRKIFLGALVVLSFILYLFAGVPDISMNYDRIVGIPAMLSACAFLFEALGIVQFCVVKHRTTEQNYQDITTKVMFASFARAILLGIAGVGCIFNMIRMGFSAGGVFVMFAYCVSAALAVLIHIQYHKIPLKVEDNTTIFEYDTYEEEEE